MQRIASLSNRFLLALVLVSGSAVGAATPAGEGCAATGAEMAGLMQTTRINGITEYAGAIADFKPDGDPGTLEIVFMKKQKDVSSVVSDDGEVIFLVGKVKDAEQQQMISMAFCRKAIARRA